MQTVKDGVRCGLCAAWTDFRQSIPTYNGDVVSNDFPDELHRQGGGSFPVCMMCYKRHARGEVECFDRYYIPQEFEAGARERRDGGKSK